MMSGHVLKSNEELLSRFGMEEYFVFVATLMVSLLIGLFFWLKSRKENDNINYLLGGKDMGLLPMTLSLIASFMSAIALLGIPAEIYTNGTMFCYIILSYPLAMLLTSKLFIPVFVDLGVTTSYEYLEWRFNKPTRILASALFNVNMLLYMAVVVYAPALAIAQITGLSIDLSCIVIFVVCIIYTAAGGIKAVMWTDVFQMLVMFGSYVVITLMGNNEAGGVGQVFKDNWDNGRIELFNVNPSPLERHSLWSVVTGNLVIWLSLYGVNQTMVQRYLSVATIKKATQGLWLNVLGVWFLILLCSYVGLTIFAFYHQAGCDPIQSGQVSSRDQLLPLFTMQVVGNIPLIPGLFVAGVFSGALSTVSSGLNALAGVAVQDFIVSACNKDLSVNTSTIITKILAIVYGFIALALIYVVKKLPAIVEAAMAIHGPINGPILGVFILGTLVPFVNGQGALSGLCTGFMIATWIAFGQTVSRHQGHISSSALNASIELCPSEWLEQSDGNVREHPENWFPHLILYEISYLWLAVIGLLVSLTVGIVVSLLTGKQDASKLYPNLVTPFLRHRVGSNFVWSEKENRLQHLQLANSASGALKESKPDIQMEKKSSVTSSELM